jgi:hypothetical protein
MTFCFRGAGSRDPRSQISLPAITAPQKPSAMPNMSLSPPPSLPHRPTRTPRKPPMSAPMSVIAIRGPIIPLAGYAPSAARTWSRYAGLRSGSSVTTVVPSPCEWTPATTQLVPFRFRTSPILGTFSPTRYSASPVGKRIRTTSEVTAPLFPLDLAQWLRVRVTAEGGAATFALIVVLYAGTV